MTCRTSNVVLLAGIVGVLSSAVHADTVVVDAAKGEWQEGRGLEPDTSYVVFPDPQSRWSLAGAGAQNDFHGTSSVGGGETPVSVPVPVQLGGLVVLVWHHNASGDHTAEIISFPPGRNYASVRVGQHGGSMHFMIADLTGTYGDNTGTCKLRFEKDDGTGRAFRPELPITASKGSATWTIDQAGAVTGSITYTVGSGSGSKKYSSGLVVEYFDGGTYTADATETVGRPFTGTRRGTEHFDRPSIPTSKLTQIRRVYVKYEVDKGLDTIREWKDTVLELIAEADKDYQKLKDNGLVQDAVKFALSP